MTYITSLTAPALWEPPAGVRVRGTLALVAGAGESPRVYERFGRRISADGYLVGVFETADAAEAARWLTAQDAAPRVLAGSDVGAAAALTVAADGASVDGVIVAALPVGGAQNGQADAAQRTACPVHLGVLDGADARAARPVADIEVPDAAALARIAVPVLAIHGGADPIASFPGAHQALGSIAELELVETIDGLHDALNDVSHRSVAAAIVLWLERLRGVGVETPIVRTTTIRKGSS